VYFDAEMYQESGDRTSGEEEEGEGRFDEDEEALDLDDDLYEASEAGMHKRDIRDNSTTISKELMNSIEEKVRGQRTCTCHKCSLISLHVTISYQGLRQEI